MPIAETRLIERIAHASAAAHPALRRPPSARVLQSIGDDCAVLSTLPGTETLVTTDFSLEGVHFRREWHPADSVGHRCLTRGLSDIAAMGGEPFAAFLSLAMPAELPQRWADQFFDGLLNTAKKAGVTLAGGDVAQSPAGVLADITVIGTVPEGKAILRSTAPNPATASSSAESWALPAHCWSRCMPPPSAASVPRPTRRTSILRPSSPSPASCAKSRFPRP